MRRRWSSSCVAARGDVTRPSRISPKSCGSTGERCSAFSRSDPCAATLPTGSPSHSVAIPVNCGQNGSADRLNERCVFTRVRGG